MLSSLIEKYKSQRRLNYLNRLTSHRFSYAFIGAGLHSTGNLYPCLHQLNVPLKYICTKTAGNAQKMAASFPGATGITDISAILQDPAVRGVFIATQPALQPVFTRQLLQAGKSVFVEKPPCSSLKELNELIVLQGMLPCVVGLQRRYSTLHKILKERSLSRATYHYRYLTGPFPEGDPLYELFIHPIDYAIQLLGNARIATITQSQSGPLLTWLIHLIHANGASGIIELSTSYSWSPVIEYLEINTEKELLRAAYPFQLTGIEKPARIAGIPLDKIIPRPTLQRIYLDEKGTVPIAANNSLVYQGFFGEIDHFVSLVEREKTSPDSSLASLQNTYELLEQLKTAGVR